MPIEKLPLLYPQLILTLGILASLITGVFHAESVTMRKRITWLSLAFLLLAIAISLSVTTTGTVQELFQFDAFTKFFLLIAILAAGMTLIFASQSQEISGRHFPEFAALLLTICIGISLMAAAQDLLMIYLAMEMVSLSSYIVTGFKRTHPLSHEAALKYVIYGGVASGIMVFGMSLLYGLVGTTSFAGIAQAFTESSSVYATGNIGLIVITLAVAMIFTGFSFKIAAVPFHMWCPDVYQGAPTPFTGFLSVVPKAAGFALLLRFTAGLLPQAVGNINDSILGILGLMSAITMTLGNFAALHQTNVKRMLAYSSIAHAGYLLMGIVVLDIAGASAVLLYLVIYLFMNIGAFAVIQAVADAVGSEELTAFRGLGYRAPLMAVCMGIFLFSLAGIPPLAGFIGKFYLFAALIRNGGFWCVVLAIIAILNSVVALFYYALIIREMFLRPAESFLPLQFSSVLTGLVILTAVPVVILGIYWEPLQQAVNQAVVALGLLL